MIERGVRPFGGIVTRCAALADLTVKVVLRSLLTVAGVAIVLQRCRKRVMHETPDCKLRLVPLVIGMTSDTGIRGKTSMKKGLSAPVRQHLTGNGPDSDIGLPVTADALQRGAAERFVTAQAAVFQSPVSVHERARVDQPVGIREDQGD
jgi:hypothetical protein